MTTQPTVEGARALESYGSVREWQFSFQNFWRTDGPPDSWKAALGRFAEQNGTDPDAIIDEVLKPAPAGEGLLLRTRARRKYVELVDDFERQEGRAAANAVRSFLIHNGIAMTPGILR